MDSLVKQIREHLLLACFDPLKSPSLGKQNAWHEFDHQDDESEDPPIAADEDDSYNYECPVCKEFTMFSSSKMLPDGRYRELCLTDTCMKKEVEKFIKDNKLDNDV